MTGKAPPALIFKSSKELAMPTATESAKKKGKAKPAVAKSAKKSGNSGSTQFVFFFGGGRAEGHGTMKAELGDKGAALAERTNAGRPCPPPSTLPTHPSH